MNRKMALLLSQQSDSDLLSLTDGVNYVRHKEVMRTWGEGRDIEILTHPESWAAVSHVDLNFRGRDYRIKKNTILVNGIEVPAPESNPPNFGEDYYVPVWSMGYTAQLCYRGSDLDKDYFRRGLIYKTSQDARDRAKAMLKFTTTEEKEV